MTVTVYKRRELLPFVGERKIFQRINDNAKQANRVFDIGFAWFVKVCHEPCHYCGAQNVNKISVPSKRPGEYLIKDFRYNGLDRIDNSIGYVESNCVPCCIICNRAKNSMAYDDFVGWINNMIIHRSTNAAQGK